ncbi:unnamed protein product, partial [Timema podura]|nr:unnamed protein product [Timema podura]
RSGRSPCPIIGTKHSQIHPGANVPGSSIPATAASTPIATTSTAPTVTTALPVMTTTTTTSHRDIVTTPVVGRSHSPRGHSPTRERDSYSSNVSSLSRSSITPVSVAVSAAITSNSSPFSSPATAVVSSSLAFSKTPAWVSYHDRKLHDTQE